MPPVIGAGKFRYEYQPGWARLPEGTALQQPSGVAVDSRDRVYVYQRQGPPVLVFDRDGNLLDSWERKNGVPLEAHHIHVGPDDAAYLVDRDAHQVLIYDTSGNLQRSLGIRDQAAMQAPFNHPADVCIAPSGELYVADGYGNSCVHRFSPSGHYTGSFGEPGSGPGEFRVPHSVSVSGDGRVFVADRENNRVQVFTALGEFLEEWTDFKCPMGVHIDASQMVYVSDQIPRISIYTLEGTLVSRGRTFENAHQVYTDSQGSIYGIDTANQRVQKLARL
ncbi:MAG: peptidyl-alpha-hydroxyglycine alpha-amidating lyase family protein [Chloroflexota bacterium]|nr:peptidyl-alpha-hydroxyglycine alpha-amidating lyase family protein [Chloroflexota bacterium]